MKPHIKGIRFFAALLVFFMVPIRTRASAPHLITITGTGAVVQLSTTDQQATSVQFTAPAANSGIARLGDSTTSSTVGEALPAGSGQYFAPQPKGAYSLNSWYVYVVTGDVLVVTWMDTL